MPYAVHSSVLAALLGLGLVLGVSGAAQAATAPGPGPGPGAGTDASAAPVSKGELKAMREFRLLDANGDGRLSRGEVVLFPRLAAAFDAADTNHDGYVSYDEVRAFAVKYRAERARQKAEQAAQAEQAAAKR